MSRCASGSSTRCPTASSCWSWTLPDRRTVADAVARSGLLQQFPEIGSAAAGLRDLRTGGGGLAGAARRRSRRDPAAAAGRSEGEPAPGAAARERAEPALGVGCGFAGAASTGRCFSTLSVPSKIHDEVALLRLSASGRASSSRRSPSASSGTGPRPSACRATRAPARASCRRLMRSMSSVSRKFPCWISMRWTQPVSSREQRARRRRGGEAANKRGRLRHSGGQWRVHDRNREGGSESGAVRDNGRR